MLNGIVGYNVPSVNIGLSPISEIENSVPPDNQFCSRAFLNVPENEKDLILRCRYGKDGFPHYSISFIGHHFQTEIQGNIRSQESLDNCMSTIDTIIAELTKFRTFLTEIPKPNYAPPPNRRFIEY